MNSNIAFSSDRLERITKLLQGYIDRREVAGMSALIGAGGDVVYRQKVGWQDIEEQKALAYDTIFRIMSMTKPVTAVAAMLLYEEGRFDLNTPISEFLPAFATPKVAVGWNEDGAPQTEDARSPITFRHLFTHTAGIGYGGLPDDPLDQLYRQTLNQGAPGEETIQGFAGKLAQLPLAHQPGSRWRYGFNLDVLGALVEVMSGLSLAEFMQQRIFDPLGMVDTGFTLPAEKHGRLATLYRKHPQEGTLVKQASPVPMVARMWGGGGLVSTLDDYAHFAAMLANKGRFGDRQLLSPTTIAMFSINWADTEALPSFVATGPRINGGYGLSLGTATLIDPSPTGKYGNVGEFYWGGAFSTYFWVDPRLSLYAVLMCQHNPVWEYPTPWQFKQLTYQAITGINAQA